MRKMAIGAWAIAAVLAGCRAAPPRAVVAGQGLEPGMYRLVLTVGADANYSRPDADADAAAQVGQLCLSEAAAAEGIAALVRTIPQGQCHYGRFESANGTLFAAGRCRTGAASHSDTVLSGHWSGTGADLAVVTRGMGGLELKQTLHAARIGQCK